MKENKCLHYAIFLHHELARLKNFTDVKSAPSKNLCHLSNPRKSVIQTTIAENYKDLAI